LILCVCAIRKNLLKKKIPFFRNFYLSRGEEKGKGEKPREEKQRKSNTLTGQIVIHLVRVLPKRESIVFVNREKPPLLQKQYNK